MMPMSLPSAPSIGLPLFPPVMGMLCVMSFCCAGSAGRWNRSVIAETMPTRRFGVAPMGWTSDPASRPDGGASGPRDPLERVAGDADRHAGPQPVELLPAFDLQDRLEIRVLG